jgi:hypothetical protein
VELPRRADDETVGDSIAELPYLSSSAEPVRSLGANHAELFHLREDVDDPPDLCDSPSGETENEDLVLRDGFAGRREAPASPSWVPVTVLRTTTLSPSAITSSTASEDREGRE